MQVSVRVVVRGRASALLHGAIQGKKRSVKSGLIGSSIEIKTWIKSRNEPLVLEFRKDAHIHDVFKILSYYALTS